MKRAIFQFAYVAYAAVAAIGLFGCDSQMSSTGNSSNSAAPAKPTPEESFDLIVATFKRGVEDIPIGFVVRREGGHSMMSGRNEVSHELIPPPNEGDPYKGIITVDSAWKYSLQQSVDEPNEPEREDDSTNEASTGVEEGSGDSGVEILDPELVGSSNSAAQKPRLATDESDKVVKRLPEEEVVRKYELLYENGRWKLLTKLDPETEQSIENAFAKALNTQI